MKEPRLRLKEFVDNWKVIKLSEIARRVTRKNSHLESTLPLTISAAEGLISQISFFNNIVASSNLSGYYLIKKGEFAYNKSSSAGHPFGSIKRLNKYEEGALSTLYIVFNISGDVSSDYVTYFFDTSLWYKEVAMRAFEGARNHGLLNIGANDFLDINISLPADKREQQAIADFFKSLDSMITLTSKKIEKLKQTLTGCMQTMFPQEGELEPKVRFKGFEGEWKSIPLKAFAKKKMEKNVGIKYNITLTNSAEYGVINQRDFFDHDISNSNSIGGYYIINNDDFVYNSRISITAPVGPINRNQLGYTGIMSPLYLIFSVAGINKDFLSYFFKTTLWYNYMKLNGNSGARFDRLAISDDDFFNMPIAVPLDSKEQLRIANYFKSLNEMISLLSKRLDLLKHIKSACLDNMFV